VCVTGALFQKRDEVSSDGPEDSEHDDHFDVSFERSRADVACQEYPGTPQPNGEFHQDLVREGTFTPAGCGNDLNRPIHRIGSEPTKEKHMSGEADKIGGRIKQAAGDLTDNEDLKNEGEKDEAAGKVKDTVDDAKDKVNDAVDGIRDTIG